MMCKKEEKEVEGGTIIKKRGYSYQKTGYDYQKRGYI